MVNRALVPLFAAAAGLLLGCPWLEPERIACLTAQDCLDGYVCSGASGAGPGHCSTDAGEDQGPGPVSGLDLTGISINQGVEIRLLDGTDWIDSRNADVVAGRPAILRIYVTPQEVWEPRAVLATLDFDDGRTFSVQETVGNDASSDSTLSSTINIELDGDDLLPGVGFSIRLDEVEYDTDDDGAIVPYEGTQDAVRWPREEGEFEDLLARTSGVLDLRVVPVRYNADGSGRLPDTSDAAVEIIRERMMAMYPATEVRVTVDAPMDWSRWVQPNFSGWSDLLQEIYSVRAQRNMPGSSYTYGLFAPADDRWTYCGGGCVAGLSINVEQASYSDGRVSIGLGFGDVETAETMAHEVGHAHGRSHAPCTFGGGPINNPDPGYPYGNARLGVVGYDIIDGGLKAPEAYADMMAYCDPIWVSDYTWDALHVRIRAVGPEALLVGQPEVTETMSVIVDEGGLHSPRRQPASQRFLPGDTVVKVLDAQGSPLNEAAARFLPFDHIDGGLLVFPAPPEGAVGIDVPGHGSLTF